MLVLFPGLFYPGMTDPTFLSPGHRTLRAGCGLLQGRGIQQASPWDQREGLEQGSIPGTGIHPKHSHNQHPSNVGCYKRIPLNPSCGFPLLSLGRGAGAWAGEFPGFRA